MSAWCGVAWPYLCTAGLGKGRPGKVSKAGAVKFTTYTEGFVPPGCEGPSPTTDLYAVGRSIEDVLSYAAENVRCVPLLCAVLRVRRRRLLTLRLSWCGQGVSAYAADDSKACWITRLKHLSASLLSNDAPTQDGACKTFLQFVRA